MTKTSEETILSKVVKLVEEAQKVKSPTEKFIDNFSKYYTPTILILAIGVATIPTLGFGWRLSVWGYRALVLLVVSCPCALVISTPVAMVSGITRAAREGILIKGSAYIEKMNEVHVVAFDKTGTLTEGVLTVTDIISLGHSEEEVLFKAACLEVSSEHPIAQAIVEKFEERAMDLQAVKNFEAIPGKGATCEIDNQRYYVGSRRLFKEMDVDLPEDQIQRLEKEGKTVVCVGNQEGIIGLIAIMDKIRDTAKTSVDQLKEMGIRTEMITGDNQRTAEAIANKIGIEECHAELLPDDKVNLIGGHLTRDYGAVAMVGDGVNDAPALATASVGIAMGVIGSDVALETADIALMQDDLSKLPYIIELSKRTMTVVKQNVVASILIKGSFAILALPGLITLWIAVAIGDMGLSLAVILNALKVSLAKIKTTQQ